MTVIVDYGVGNLFSLSSSLYAIGEEAVVSGDAKIISAADKLILPGVGAFRDAAGKLSASGLVPVIKKAAGEGKPLLGICLGMQLLFEKSYEFGEFAGLSLLSGSVVSMQGRIPENLKIPHIGWNALHKTSDSALLKNVREGEFVYFVHSYYAAEADSTVATAEYGVPLCAAVERGNVCGCQFHPEKSGEVGLRILRSFCKEGGKA